MITPSPAGIEITGTAQREAWLQRVMPPVEQLATDLWSIPVPIPDNPLRYDRLLEDGELADLPGWKLRALHMPGHTPGHLCFVDERSRRLFSGDHVLPRITPNISVQRGDPASPLQSYLDSLQRTRDLDVDQVLPAHEWRFRGLAGRVDAITAHHGRRLAELLAAVRRHPGAAPWELAGQLTWSRPWAEYGGQMRIFAVTETAAHLDLLEHRGLVTASGTRPPGYTATAPDL
jgi:glyoxylase-like metal-dependent hydrolase (beta-lactamase superfamily II)